MRHSLWIAPLLLAIACASSDGIDGNRTMRCGPGSPVGVSAGLHAQGVQIERAAADDQLTLVVNVSNNTAHDIAVKAIRSEQTSTYATPYVVGEAYRQFDVTIAPGDDHDFELPTSGRASGEPLTRDQLGGPADAVSLALTVVLDDGTAYRCPFSFPAPR